jgi:ubiquinone/menaquinone biosynthesis C-methylase UbiE
MFELKTSMLEGIPQNGPTDPIEYYKKPLIGQLFRTRINRGLALLPEQRFDRVLEVGFGAGAVQLALAAGSNELHGIDLDADPVLVTRLLNARGIATKLQRGNVYALPYADCSFDLIVCFSVFEHLHDYPKALAEVQRVLAPSGLFLLGMPAVTKWMEFAFAAIGFKGIDDHHVTRPQDVAAALPSAGFVEVKASFLDLPLPAPLGLRMYYNLLLRKSTG